MDHLLVLIIVVLMTIHTVIKILTIDNFYKIATSWDFARNSYVTFMTICELFYLFGIIILLKYEFWNYGICLLVLECVIYAESGIKGRYSKTFYVASSLLALFFLVSFLVIDGGV